MMSSIDIPQSCEFLIVADNKSSIRKVMPVTISPLNFKRERYEH